MLDRLLRPRLEARLADSPAVVLLGPRQVGKTTLARSFSRTYFDLEQPEERTRLDVSWESVTTSRELVVLDEAQADPAVFARLRGAIDADRRRMGRFLLLGSVSPGLLRGTSESLAGRAALLELAPLVFDELTEAQRRRHWLTGGFPDGGVLGGARFPDWQLDYLNLLAQRDLPEWGLAARPQHTMRLLKMLALNHAQPWNASQIGQALGVSYHTANTQLEVLEGAFLFRRLPPLEANLRKRLVRTPRLFLRDSGLLHALLGVTTEEDLLVQPWVGASFEGYVIGQVLDTLAARNMRHEAHFFRTSDGKEIDLVIDLGVRRRWAIEIKLTTAPSPATLAELERTAALVDATHCALVTRRTGTDGANGRFLTDLRGLVGLLTAE